MRRRQGDGGSYSLAVARRLPVGVEGVAASDARQNYHHGASGEPSSCASGRVVHRSPGRWLGSSQERAGLYAGVSCVDVQEGSVRWLDVCGPPGSGKSTLCDPLWGPHQVSIENRLPPAECHDFLNEVARLFYLIRSHPSLGAAIRMNNRSIRKIT